MSYSSLHVYYKTIWSLTFHHKYSITELENLIPYERDLMVKHTADYIREQEEERERMRNQGRDFNFTQGGWNAG